MIRVILYLFLLKVSFAEDSPTVQPEVLKVAYFGPPGVPSWPDSINVGDIHNFGRRYAIYFKDVTLHNLSSAYAVKYRIDFGKHTVLTSLTFGSTQMQGRYSLTVSSDPNPPTFAPAPDPTQNSSHFVVNTYQMILSYSTVFHEHNGTVVFEKPVDNNPRVNTVRNEIPADLVKYPSSTFGDRIKDKLNEEFRQRMNLDDVAVHIKRYLFNKRLAAMGERLKTIIYNVLTYDDLHSNIFDVFYFDITNSTHTIGLFKGYKYEVTVPSFTLQAQQKFLLPENFGNITFAEDGIRLHSISIIPSPRLVAKIVYRRKDQPLAESKTVEGVYQLRQLKYEFRIFANLETASVELEDVSASQFGGVTLANEARPYNDDRDDIIRNLSYILFETIDINCANTFKHYMRGIMADGRIAAELFDKNKPTPIHDVEVET